MPHSNIRRNNSSGWYLWSILSIVALLVLVMWVRGCRSTSKERTDIVEIKADYPVLRDG